MSLNSYQKKILAKETGWIGSTSVHIHSFLYVTDTLYASESKKISGSASASGHVLSLHITATNTSTTDLDTSDSFLCLHHTHCLGQLSVFRCQLCRAKVTGTEEQTFNQH